MTEKSTQPLVSVITPVYNGEEFLAECIESVLAQTYQNWDYTIVNNRSTDRTLEIAQTYAARDVRIRVQDNREFLPIIQNHNSAIRQISPHSKYCKVVFADDWLFPQCLTEMVKVAEEHPTVGIVGAYGLDGSRVLWTGLPYPSTFVSGRELCRRALFGGPYIFGTATSLLIRSDLIRSRHPFYDEASLHADQEVCFELLQISDFGFAHQVLTYSRIRPNSNHEFAQYIDSIALGNLGIVLKYGPIYLTSEEYETGKEPWLKSYYLLLAKSVLRLRDRAFWEYHLRRLDALGYKLDRLRLAKALAGELFASLTRPIDAFRGVLDWWPRRLSTNRKAQGDSQKVIPILAPTAPAENFPHQAKSKEVIRR